MEYIHGEVNPAVSQGWRARGAKVQGKEKTDVCARRVDLPFSHACVMQVLNQLVMLSLQQPFGLG